MITSFKIKNWKDETVEFLTMAEFVLSAWEVKPGAPKVNLVDVPFRNGSLDLTENLTGEVNFKNDELEMEFGLLGDTEENRLKINEVINKIHGKKCEVNLPNGDVRIGRMMVESAGAGRLWKITIGGLLDV